MKAKFSQVKIIWANIVASAFFHFSELAFKQLFYFNDDFLASIIYFFSLNSILFTQR